MQKEIGSTYWLNPSKLEGLPKRSLKTPKLNENFSYVSTCRSAIGICLDTLSDNRKIALLPAFTCESVLVSFLDRGYEVYPYPIRRDLTIDWEKFHESVEQLDPSVILVHSYFGFNTIGELKPHVKELREKGIIVIEDQTQTMFSKNALAGANYYVGSIRKWMPVPDGAFVSSPIKCTEEDDELACAKVKALTAKGDWMLNEVGTKPEFQGYFRSAEGILDSRKKPYLMSSVAREIYASTDIENVRKIRRSNCQQLISGILVSKVLSEKLVLPVSEIGAEECPFHLPVLVKEGRIELQQYLASKDIFATVIWGCPEEYKETIDEDSKYVYDHILCFHVDQRYDESDMNRILDVLNEYYKKCL